MLLKLIKTKQMPSGTHAEIVEVNSVTGNIHLADVFVMNEHLPSELIYPLTVTRTALYIRGKEVGWQWKDRITESAVMSYLRYVQSIRSEIYLDVCRKEAELPGYPYVDYNPKDYPIVMGIEDAVVEGEIKDDALRDLLMDGVEQPELQ